MQPSLSGVKRLIPSLRSRTSNVAPNPMRAVRPTIALCVLMTALTLAASPAAHAQDLTITKTAPATVAPGANLTYDITFKNQGDTLTQGNFSDNLPNGTTFQSLTQTAGTTLPMSTPPVGEGGFVGNANGFFDVPPVNGQRIDSPSEMTVLGNQLFFNGSFSESLQSNKYGILKTDGTANGTSLTVENQLLSRAANRNGALTYAGKIYFTGPLAASNGLGLYALDASGSTLIRTLFSSGGNISGSGTTIKATSGGFYTSLSTYNSNTGTRNNTLYFSDGTSAGTVVMQSGANYAGVAENTSAVVGDSFFYPNTANSVSGLWKSQGTAATTTLVKADLDVYELATLGNAVYFTGFDRDTNAGGLFKSDGTTAGTVLVKEFSPFQFLTPVGSSLYFKGRDPNTGVAGLWKSDGTAAGTVVISNAVTPSTNNGGLSPQFLALGGVVYFMGTDTVTNDRQIWKTNGTAAGTMPVTAIGDTDNSSSIDNLQVAGSSLFFSAFTPELGTELYKSDGTMAGTVLVKDIYPGTVGSSPYELTVLGNKIVFSASKDRERALYISDGTAVGTQLLTLPPPTGAVFSFQLVVKVTDELPVTSLSNTALFPGNRFEANTDNNSSTAVTQVLIESRSLVVTTLGDVVKNNDNLTSLREAVTYAGDLGGAQTVSFTPSLNGVINLDDERREITLSSDMTIDGDNRISIKGSLINSGISTIVVAANGANVTLRNLKFINTANAVSANGSSAGSLTVNGCTFSNNGSSIYANVPLVVDNSVFEGGTTTPVTASGMATIRNSIFRNNGTAAANSGIALLSYGAMTVTNTQFESNFASSAANISVGTASFTDCAWTSNTTSNSAFYNGATATLTRCVFRDNVSSIGAIYNQGTLTLTNGTLSGNTGHSGGIYNGGPLTVTNSTLSGNTARNQGGAIYNGSTLTVTGSTLSGNTATGQGGAVFSATSGTLSTTLTQCTLVGNASTNGDGGAICNLAGNTRLNNCTIVGNSAAGVGGVASNGDTETSTTISNTIIVGNFNDVSLLNSSTNSFVSGGYNLIGTGSGTASFNKSGDRILVSAADANLDTLKDNGGLTQTIALLTHSLAINTGDPAVTDNGQFDQRGAGNLRVKRGRLDIGAFESNLIFNTAPNFPASSYTAGLNDALSIQLTATDIDNDPLTYSSANLPAGVTLSASGLMGGQPATVGNFLFQVTVNDGRGGAATTNIFIAVRDVPAGSDTLGPILTHNALPKSMTRAELAAFTVSGTVRDVAPGAITPAGVRRVLVNLRTGDNKQAYNGSAFTTNLNRGYYIATQSAGTGNPAETLTYSRALSFVPTNLPAGPYILVLYPQDLAGNYSAEFLQFTVTAPAAPTQSPDVNSGSAS